MTADVICRVEGRTARITLNRPSALHALTREMCQAMTDRLLAWRDDAGVAAVMIDHGEGRGFCAGGDIRLLAESGRGDGAAAEAFEALDQLDGRLGGLVARFHGP
jgi:enoyl-CoA hydratase